jgi:hypothetical protein
MAKAKKEINWRKVDVGTWFSATIDGVKAVGQVTGEANTVYLCQQVKDGDDARNKLGWPFSWNVQEGTAEDLNAHGVTKFKLLKGRPKGLKQKLIITIRDNVVEFHRGHIKIGCTTVDNATVRKIAKHLKA